MAPAVLTTPRSLAHRKVGTLAVDTDRVHSHDHDHDQDHDTVEAQYACLERLRAHACTDGVVYIGHLVVGEDGEEVEVFERVRCRKCGEAR
jgi:hypothetical protein